MFSLLTTLDIDMYYGVRRLQHKTKCKRSASTNKNHSKYDIKLIDVCSMCLLHLCLTTTSVLRLTTFSTTRYASAKRSVLLHFLRIPFVKESNCRPNELHCLLVHLHRALITFLFLCNKSTYVTRISILQ